MRGCSLPASPCAFPSVSRGAAFLQSTFPDKAGILHSAVPGELVQPCLCLHCMCASSMRAREGKRAARSLKRPGRKQQVASLRKQQAAIPWAVCLLPMVIALCMKWEIMASSLYTVLLNTYVCVPKTVNPK